MLHQWRKKEDKKKCVDVVLPEEKKEIIKKYFFTNKVSTEIMAETDSTYSEYCALVKEVKKELNLPENYRRNPRGYGKYHKGCYMLLDPDENLINYYPTRDLAMKNNNVDGTVVKAEDEELLNLIEKDYDDTNMDLSMLMTKYKLPYPKILDLIKKMKNRRGIVANQYRTRNKFHHIYKYPPNDKLIIKKYIGGKLVNFGYYENYDDAVKMRDYLESIGWNYTKWFANRKNILKMM